VTKRRGDEVTGVILLRCLARLAAAGVMLGPAAAAAQDAYPGKVIRIITPATGGGSDFVARLIAPGLSASLGQQVIVDNRGAIAPVQFAAAIRTDIERIRKLARDANIKVD